MTVFWPFLTVFCLPGVSLDPPVGLFRPPLGLPRGYPLALGFQVAKSLATYRYSSWGPPFGPPPVDPPGTIILGSFGRLFRRFGDFWKGFHVIWMAFRSWRSFGGVVHVWAVVVVDGGRARGMVLVDDVARVRARACGCPSCRFVARGMFVGDDDFS